jgi:hypothetical protein
MKGYETSNDYGLLWDLINDGYRIPAWMPNPDDYPGKETNPLYVLVEIKIIPSTGRYCIGSRGVGYEQEEQTKESFVQVCKYWDVKWVMVETTMSNY